MGWYDYLSDLAGSLAIQSSDADQQNQGPADDSGEQSRGKDVNSGGPGTAEHRGGSVRGGVSTKSPASGTNEESGSEKEENERQTQKSEEGEKEDEGGESSEDGEEASGKSEDGGDDSKGDEEEGGEDEGDGEEEEDEEEEEEEPEDIKEKLEEDCMKTQQCAPLKHHYDECAERVKNQQDTHGKAHEDCVEEFFHMMHCATQCAAPKLFRQLR